MGKKSKRKQARQVGGTAHQSTFVHSCYLCFKPFRDGEQATRLTIPGVKPVDLCAKCAAEMQRDHPQMKHLGHVNE